mgnify:CR=1 FL=1
MVIVFLLGCLLVGYLLGSVNGSIIVGRCMGIDIRSQGSKNAGATNALRVLGKKAAALVFLFDFFKAVLAVLLARFAAGWMLSLGVLQESNAADFSLYGQYLAGLGAVLGHNFPLYFHFKGGKGILASWGVIMILDYRIAIALVIVFILVVWATRYVSLASITSAILYPLFVIAFNAGNLQPGTAYYIALSLIISILAVYRHRANIARLTSGTESKLGAKKDKKE